MPILRGRRASRLSIALKLNLITIVTFAIVLALSGVTVLVVNVLSGLRAYIAGEGLYSKYQRVQSDGFER